MENNMHGDPLVGELVRYIDSVVIFPDSKQKYIDAFKLSLDELIKRYQKTDLRLLIGCLSCFYSYVKSKETESKTVINDLVILRSYIYSIVEGLQADYDAELEIKNGL